jgi:hypothetical protein
MKKVYKRSPKEKGNMPRENRIILAI